MQHAIPYGAADYFWAEALQRQQLTGNLLETFRRWGYGDAIPPIFEYADSLSAQASPKLRAEMYRFLDRDGSTLALRPEFTTPLARLVATRLHDWPMPQRFCYAGSVFRYVSPQAGRQREFLQAGVELIGASTPEADAEVLALTVAALRAAELADFRVVVGQIRYFGGLLADLKLSPEHEDALREAIDRKSEPALEAFLRDVPLRTQQRRTVEELPNLNGSRLDQIIDQADRYCLNYEMHAALENLRAVCAVLAAYGVTDAVDLDLTEIRNLGYYTGVTFEALAPGMGFAIASGGRYDDLIGHFGKAQPAVGVAMGVDRLLLARQRQRGEQRSPHPPPPDCLAMTGDDPTALAQVQRWREEGQRVQVEVNGRTPDDVIAYARKLGIARVLRWTGASFEEMEV
ncbi:MAG: ATP phosphoribosyltransferase regulatory subunit [Caldilineaceae bacterium]|nr:ATP phosphoribosyltransferase regulatory subunit [Caldilineaceae bacterium]